MNITFGEIIPALRNILTTMVLNGPESRSQHQWSVELAAHEKLLAYAKEHPDEVPTKEKLAEFGFGITSKHAFSNGRSDLIRKAKIHGQG